MKLFKNEKFLYYLTLSLLVICALMLILSPEEVLYLILRLIGLTALTYSTVNLVPVATGEKTVTLTNLITYVALGLLGGFLFIFPSGAITLTVIGFGLYYIITGGVQIFKIYTLLPTKLYKKSDYILPALSVLLGIVLMFFGGAAIKIACIGIGATILIKLLLTLIENGVNHTKGKGATDGNAQNTQNSYKSKNKKDDFIESDFVDKSK